MHHLHSLAHGRLFEFRRPFCRRAGRTGRPSGLSRNVRVLGLTSLVNDIASEMIYPLLPTLLLTVLRGEREDVALVLGLVEGVGRRHGEHPQAVCRWLVGSHRPAEGLDRLRLLDGRPPPARCSVWSRCPGRCSACRVGDRFGKGLRTAARDAIIAESTPPAMRGWAFGFHRAMDHLGAAIGPLLALRTSRSGPAPTHSNTVFADADPGDCGGGDPGLWTARAAASSVAAAAPFVWSLKPFSGNFRVYLLAMFVFSLGNSSDSLLLLRGRRTGNERVDADSLVVHVPHGQKRRQPGGRQARSSGWAPGD